MVYVCIGMVHSWQSAEANSHSSIVILQNVHVSPLFSHGEPDHVRIILALWLMSNDFDKPDFHLIGILVFPITVIISIRLSAKLHLPCYQSNYFPKGDYFHTVIKISAMLVVKPARNSPATARTYATADSEVLMMQCETSALSDFDLPNSPVHMHSVINEEHTWSLLK